MKRHHYTDGGTGFADIPLEQNVLPNIQYRPTYDLFIHSYGRSGDPAALYLWNVFDGVLFIVSLFLAFSSFDYPTFLTMRFPDACC